MKLNNSQKQDVFCDPVLRWAGGKRWIKTHIEELIGKIDFKNYYEPFFGGGSVFFSSILCNKSFLNDLNQDLINTYQIIKNEPDELIKSLSKYQQTENSYYKIRKTNPKDAIIRASRFIFLNKTCFNGLYRVNRNGEFNVPYGKKTFNIEEVSAKIKNCSIKLQTSKLSSTDFASSLNKIHEKDLVFLDPPYTVTHNNNGFVKYNEKIFSLSDQKRLRKYIDHLNKVNAYFIMSNANHKIIKEIFSGTAEIYELERKSLIGSSKKSRGVYKELLISNI